MNTKIVLDDAEIVRLGKKLPDEYPCCLKELILKVVENSVQYLYGYCDTEKCHDKVIMEGIIAVACMSLITLPYDGLWYTHTTQPFYCFSEICPGPPG